jgi:DNA-binding MarR family transcriptional regulator
MSDETVTALTDLLLSRARLIRRASAAELAPLGLTPGQSRGLRIIARAESPVRMADIAAALDVVPRTATSIVDALEAAGLVARSADASDRRAVLVRLTDDGRELQERLRWARVRAADEALAPLSESERAELARLLAMVCCPGPGERGPADAGPVDAAPASLVTGGPGGGSR